MIANEQTDAEVRPITALDLRAISELHSAAFGPGRFARTAYRVRENAPMVSPHCRTAWRGEVLIGSVSMTAISVGDSAGHWLLGPLAVRAADANKGQGRRLVRCVLKSIADHEPENATVILVGDTAYYGPLGFEPMPGRLISLPGPVDPARLLIWRGPEGGRQIPKGLIRAAPRNAVIAANAPWSSRAS